MTYPISADGTGFHTTDGQAVRKLDNLSIVTRFKNRKSHLMASLPTWLKLPVAEIVIVDWDSDDGELTDLIRYVDDKRLKIVRVEGKQDFDRSAAWNVGIANASAEWVMMLDADVRIANPIYFNDPIFASKNYEIYYRFFADNFTPQLFGSGIIQRDHWAAIGGFHEGMTGWGWEDVDFFRRMEKRWREVTLPLGAFLPENHEDDTRVTFHAEKDLRFSSLKNSYRAMVTKKIELTFTPAITVAGRNVSTRVINHQQKITYKWNPEPLLASPRFTDLAKRYNVFTTPADQLKLFAEREFVELEKRFKRGGEVVIYPGR